MSFLDSFAPQHRARLLKAAARRVLADGEVLVRRGESGTDVFLLQEGVLVAREGARLLTTLRPGAMVGEIAFVDGAPRSADVVAQGAVEVAVWSASALRALLQADGSLALAFYGAVARTQSERVRRLTDAPPEPAAEVPEVLSLEVGLYHPARGVIETTTGTVKLSPTENRLLTYLIARPGRSVTYKTLLAEVWGYSDRVESRTLYATVHRLRPKIERDPKTPRHLIAERGAYRFDP